LGSHCERIETGAGIIEVGWAHLLDDVAVKVVEHQSDDAIRLAGCRRQFGSPKGSRRMLTRHSFKVRSGPQATFVEGPASETLHKLQHHRNPKVNDGRACDLR
jgi:hypothetical protein